MEEKLHPEKSGPFFRVPGKKSHLEKSSPFPPESREEDAWLSERQLAKCSPAEVDQFGSPVPTRMVSNGEYMPIAQTEKQKRVEARILELADSASKRLGMSRRMFLATTGGFAAAFLAMNEVFGHFFNVSLLEVFEPAAYAATGAPANLYVLDDQTHLVRSSLQGPVTLRAIAQGYDEVTGPLFGVNPFNPTGLNDELGGAWTAWNPALHNKPYTCDMFNVINYIKEMFFDSQTTVAVLSNANFAAIPVPGGNPRAPTNVTESLTHEILTGEQTAGVRDFVNQIAGSTRVLAHGQLYVGIGNLHDPVFGDFTQFQIDAFHPDSWKGYNIAPAAKVDTDPNSLMRMWRLDDEAVAYPIYAVIARNTQELKKHPGFFNICVHKGLAPGPPDIPERGNPTDIPKAASDWPQFNFIIYHSSIRPAFFDYESLQDIRSGVLREGVPDISWTTQFAQLAAPFPNVYAEIGTTLASSIVTFPTVAAHILGQLMKYLGPNRIVFGSDSLWYGSPQWQIEALWRFEIPEGLREKWGYPELTKSAKRKILGLNSARLYRLPTAVGGQHGDGGAYKPVPPNFEQLIPDSLKTLLEIGQPVPPGACVVSDNFSKMKEEYLAGGGQRNNTRYGWIRTAA